jgi:diguanylate cyclase (GGDEF)-like protein
MTGNMSATNVLLVDCDAEDLALIDRFLQNDGFLLMHASGREEALKIVSEMEIQVVLLAAGAAGGEITNLMKNMRAMRRTSPPQLILLSGSNDRAEAFASLETGPDDFIHKPLDAQELLARMHTAQARWQSQATLLKEREFYRIAVAEEERLSSLVLDQNQSLKVAYDKIRALNDELAKANRELEQLAAYDSLSGLLNRRSLFTRMEIEIERCIRLETPMAGLMIDIDRFKSINDNFGHPCGDVVIREIGARLSRGLRKYDYAGRYGGEEFFIILSNTTEAQTLGISERFRRDIEETEIMCSEKLHVTVSVGASCYHSAETREEWIDRTDRAMYLAKQSGRNRVVAV